MSTSIEIDISELAPLRDALNALSEYNAHALMGAIGNEAESQTRRRIAEEKSSPSGVPWPAWSSGYAASRHGGQSRLQSDGHLLDRITHNVLGPDSVEVGSNMVYAAIHNFGGQVAVTAKSRRFFWWKFFQTGDAFWRNLALTKKSHLQIPQRQFLGLSAENEDDLVGIVEDFMGALLAEEGLE